MPIKGTIRPSLVFLFTFISLLLAISCGRTDSTNSSNGIATAAPSASPTATPVNCNVATEAEIIKTIYRELEPLKLGDTLFDFNISATAPPTLNIVGWSAKKADILAVIAKIAPDCKIPATNPPTFVETEAQLPSDNLRAGCSGGLKPCGDVCIPPDQQCAWAGTVEVKKLSLSNSNSNSKQVANSNVSSNAAANTNTNGNSAKKP